MRDAEQVPAGVDWDEHGNDWMTTVPEDIAAREAIERANGGPVFGSPTHVTHADHLRSLDPDRDALMRVIGKITIGEADRDAGDVARFVDLRQAASETPADFIKRITLALLKEMAGVE